MLRLFHSESHPIPLPSGHRFPVRKYELVRQQLEYEGLIRPEQLHSPEFISDQEIHFTHDADFWRRAKSLLLTDTEIRRIGFPQCPELISRSVCSASGTVRAACAALEDGAGMNLAGGTHHAFFDRGEGFCLLNDIAIAANVLLHRSLVKKVLVVDLDVHQGNGTASLFRDRPEVFTFSMHCAENYPFRREKSDLDVEIPAGTGGSAYLEILKGYLPALYEQVQPDIVFYLAGVDVLAGDRLGKLNLSLRDCYDRDNWVISQAFVYRIPLVTVMGGGYPEGMSKVVNAHANSFRITLETYEKNYFFLRS